MYNEQYKCSQDYEAWVRMSSVGKLSILDQVLVEWTVRKNSIFNNKSLLQCYNAFKIRRQFISLFLNFVISMYQLITGFCPKFIIRIVKKL